MHANHTCYNIKISISQGHVVEQYVYLILLYGIAVVDNVVPAIRAVHLFIHMMNLLKMGPRYGGFRT